MAKWDLSKLPEGRKPLPDEWFRERAQMQGRIEELEKELEYWRRDSAAGWDKCEEYRNKLAKAMLALDEAIYLLDPDDEDIAKETGLHRIVTICAELKGEKPTS